MIKRWKDERKSMGRMLYAVCPVAEASNARAHSHNSRYVRSLIFSALRWIPYHLAAECLFQRGLMKRNERVLMASLALLYSAYFCCLHKIALAASSPSWPRKVKCVHIFSLLRFAVCRERMVATHFRLVTMTQFILRTKYAFFFVVVAFYCYYHCIWQ